MLFPSSGNSLQAQFFGPYEVERKVNDLNYIVKTPGRRKESQLCHINMLKVYQSENTEKQETPVVTNIPVEIKPECGGSNNIHTERTDINDNLHEPKLQNSVVLSELDWKLYHLEPDMAQELTDLIRQYEKIFSDIPSRTNVAYHDVDIGDARPVKQPPYRYWGCKTCETAPLQGKSHLQKEVQYYVGS